MRQTSRAVALLLTLESAQATNNVIPVIITGGFLDATTHFNEVISTDAAYIASNR